ncbi:hypothetical protein [Nocardia sp. NPDC057030]|uniref:hypothetical protein n=1 Tax=unclassified Nocardia TaxID=2637762 RepID=UPI003644D3C1
MAIKPATQQDTETLIFANGFPSSYLWWHSIESDGWERADKSPFHAPDGWVYVVTAENPDDENTPVEKRIDHAAIMKAARTISAKEFKASGAIKKAARDMQLNAENCAHEIDSTIADAVLQVAVYGAIVYP